MAVSKRVRFEVLRRDNHTCGYCGGTAPDATLTVDHVIPTSLGGSDDPTNLVAACRDCNYGKASTNPDSILVENVADDAIRWASALQMVAKARAEEREKRDEYVVQFAMAWDKWHYGPEKKVIPWPANYEQSIWRFYELGLPIEELLDCVNIACGNERVPAHDTFRYFAGCAWRAVTAMQEAARAVITAEEVESGS